MGGAGGFGRYVYAQLRERKDIDIRCFVDSNPNIVGKKVDGISISASEQLYFDNENIVDYVLVSFLDGIRIYNQLSKYRNIKFGIVKDRVFKDKLKIKNRLMDDSNIFWVSDSSMPLLKSVETHIVDYCNLNCKGCSHFSNLYHSGDRIPFDTYCRDLQRLSQKVNIFLVSMLGGEALIHERIIDYIDFTRRILPYADISIITNGLLLPKQKEDFFISCVENNIAVEVSEYLPTSQMLNHIICILEQYGIVYKIRKNINMFMKNIDLSGKADKNKAMKSCLRADCNFLREGRLYKCPFEALGNKFFEYFHLKCKIRGGGFRYI